MEAVNEPELRGPVGTARWDSSVHYFAVAASYILSQFPLVKDHWPSGWQPTLQVCGSWQARGEENFQQISQLQTLWPHFPQRAVVHSLPGCGVASLPCQAGGAGWQPRGGWGKARGGSGQCDSSQARPHHFPSQNKPQSPARSCCWPRAHPLPGVPRVPALSPSHGSLTAALQLPGELRQLEQFSSHFFRCL